MPKNIISGDPIAQEMLRQEFRRQHEYNLWMWRLRLTKAEARAIAWQRMREKLGR